MLTIKQITDDKEGVIRGLEKKHFSNAKEVINAVLETNNCRKKTQVDLDNTLSFIKQSSKQIGALMKEGQIADAEKLKTDVASAKERAKGLECEMKKVDEDLRNLLYTIPNIPYDEVPEGSLSLIHI